MTARILFLCARGSSRSLLAASLLADQAGKLWDAWSTPPRDAWDHLLAQQVLREQGIDPIAPDHFTQPVFGMQWDEGVVLCSGATDL